MALKPKKAAKTAPKKQAEPPKKKPAASVKLDWKKKPVASEPAKKATEEPKKKTKEAKPVVVKETLTRDQELTRVNEAFPIDDLPSPLDMWDAPKGYTKDPTKAIAAILLAIVRRNVHLPVAFACAGIPKSTVSAWLGQAERNPDGPAARLFAVLHAASAQAEMHLVTELRLTPKYQRLAFILQHRYPQRWGNAENLLEAEPQAPPTPRELPVKEAVDLLQVLEELGIGQNIIETQAVKEESK